MIDKRKLELFKDLFERSESIFILCPSDALRDQLFAAASLYATLKANTQKNIRFFVPDTISAMLNDTLILFQILLV